MIVTIGECAWCGMVGTAMAPSVGKRPSAICAECASVVSAALPVPAKTLGLAHAVNGSGTEEGLAIRAHLITMGWRPPT